MVLLVLLFHQIFIKACYFVHKFFCYQFIIVSVRGVFPPSISAYSFVMFFNFLTALALMIENPSGDSTDGETFGIAIAYFLINIPASFLCWYRPAYKALK